MSVTQFSANSRVPFFTFVDREHGINAAETKKLGYEVPLLRTFILVTPHGHKGDPLEFLAEEFIERKRVESHNGFYDIQWVKEFERGLELFRDGKEIPRTGTPLLTWERITKSRREKLALRFPTLEDLASVPDSSLGDIGLDGRVLRDLARSELQVKLDLNPVVMELADANERIRQLETSNAGLLEKIEALEKALEQK